MISLGFLTIKKNQEVAYFTDVAKSSQEEYSFYRFTPFDIVPGTEQVNGYQYNREKELWEESSFPIPQFIYDRCFYGQNEPSKRGEPIVGWLKQRPGTTFIGYGLPNKWEIYEALRKIQSVSPYLPKTTFIKSYRDIKKSLTECKNIVIKPINGSQGNGIINIDLQSTSIRIRSQYKGTETSQTFTSIKDFKQWVNQTLKETHYICQPFYSLLLDEHPFDIRILLQKNENGEWCEQGRGIRKGKKHSIVSNLHNGGEILSFDNVMNSWIGTKQLLALEEIESIIQHVPTALEDCFGRLFEIGLDIGVTDEGAVWLLDINSKPGRKVITYTNPEKTNQILQSPINYCKYLQKNSLPFK